MRKQQGITLVGMLMSVASVVILGVIAMKVIPVYLENYEIKGSIAALQDLPASNFSEDPMANVVVLRNKLMNQFDLNSISGIPAEQIVITPAATSGNYLIAVKYVVIKTLVGNVSLMFDFNESKEVTVGPK